MDIKFRCYNKKTQKMWDADSLRNMGGFALQSGHSSNDFLVLPYPSDDYVLMQFTGLKDKNGKEIYEGDLLLVEIDWGYGLAKIYSKVYYDDKEATFKSKAINSHEDTYLYNMPYLEVIGNIHENH